MVGKTNAVSGGAEPFGYIFAKYPAGSTCGLTDFNGTELFAENTSGYYVFPMPHAATWIVACFDGADYDSSANQAYETVTISAQSPYAMVELSYDLSIFEEGTGDISSLTGGWYAECNSYAGKQGSITFSESYIDFYSIGNQNQILTKNMVDFNGYSSLELEFKWDGYDYHNESYLNFAVHNASAVNGDTYTQKNMLASLIKYKDITGNRQTVSLDISAISSGKIGLAMRQAGHLYVYNISAKK